MGAGKTTMWQPRAFGITVGWLVAAAVAVYFLQDDMIQAGFFGDACKNYGLASWACGVTPKMAVWLPNMFVYLITAPFGYDGSADWIGTEYATLWLFSPIAYAIALVATNYWVWKLNQL